MKIEEMLKIAQKTRLGIFHLDDGASLTALADYTNIIEARIKEKCIQVCKDISGNEPSGAGGRFGALDCAEAIEKMP